MFDESVARTGLAASNSFGARLEEDVGAVVDCRFES